MSTQYYEEESWSNVSPGSRLEVAVACGDECVAAGTIQINGVLGGSIADSALRPGPASIPLDRAGGRYRVTVRLHFVKDGSATVTARVLQPPGDWEHPTVFETTFVGAAEERHRAASLVVLMG